VLTRTSVRFDQGGAGGCAARPRLFTYAVVEGLEGKGAMAAKREITTKGLADFVVKRVDQLAKDRRGEQEPQYFKGRDAEDYVLAR
jgi:hypothetical protein